MLNEHWIFEETWEKQPSRNLWPKESRLLHVNFQKNVSGVPIKYQEHPGCWETEDVFFFLNQQGRDPVLKWRGCTEYYVRCNENIEHW